MKQRKYQITLLVLLSIVLILNIILLVLTIIDVTKFTSDQIMDGIMYILCYILLLAFNGLQIFNTILSFKNGGVFIKNLVYNEKNTLNHNFIYILGGIQLILLICTVYFGLVTLNVNLPCGNLDKHIIMIIFSYSLLMWIDCIAVITYPIFHRDLK